MVDLSDKVVLVAGATRGGGRGIAVALGEAGATVWCTGRSVAGHTPPGRPETIEQTASLVDKAGGHGRAARTDHTEPAQVEALVKRIRQEDGRLDAIVNDIWGGDALTHWGPLWDHDLDDGLRMLRLGLTTHLVTARLALPLLLAGAGGTVVEITDGVGEHYRGSLFYDLVKAATRRLGFSLNEELRPLGHTALTATPGFLRSEAMLDHFGVTAGTWQEAVAKDPHFAESETPVYLGRGLAGLLADPDRMRFGGRVVSSGQLASEYDCFDVDGRQPHFGRYGVDLLTAALDAIADKQAAAASVEAMVAAVGPLAAPFAGVGGRALCERIRAGEVVRTAVEATVRLG